MPEFLARVSEALVSPVMGWEVNLARKLGANRSALTPIKKYSEGTLELLATNLNSCSRRSFHQLVRPEGEPLLDPAFLDAPRAASQAVLEFAGIPRNSRQSQFFVSVIRATLETRPIRYRVVECEIREVERCNFSPGVQTNALLKKNLPPLSGREIPRKDADRGVRPIRRKD